MIMNKEYYTKILDEIDKQSKKYEKMFLDYNEVGRGSLADKYHDLYIMYDDIYNLVIKGYISMKRDDDHEKN